MANLICYLELDERSGSIAAQHPTVSGVADSPVKGIVWNDRDFFGIQRTPYFDGANGSIQINNLGLGNSLSLAEGSFQLWMRVYNAGVWTDATARHIFRLDHSGSIFMEFYKTTTNNQIEYHWDAPFTVRRTITLTGSRITTEWISIAATWSLANNKNRCYFNGIAVVDSTYPNTTTTGTIVDPYSAIGSRRWAVVTWPFYGWLAHIAFWDGPISERAVWRLSQI